MAAAGRPRRAGGRLPGVVAAEADAVGDGKLAVLVPAGRAEPLAEAIGTAVPAATPARARRCWTPRWWS